MFFSLQKNSEQLMVSCPEEERDCKQTQTDRLRPRCLLTLSFYLRDSAGDPALHLRYSFLSFSRAASVLSPYPIPRAPESFTPSVGFRRSPKNFNCRYQIALLHHSTLVYECQSLFVFFSKSFVHLRQTPKTKKQVTEESVTCFYFVIYFLRATPSLADLTTMPVRANRARALGRTIR